MSEKRFQEAIDDIIKQNNKVDQDHYREAVWHFNGEKIREGNFDSTPSQHVNAGHHRHTSEMSLEWRFAGRHIVA